MAGQIYPLARGERNPQGIVDAIRDLQQRSGSAWLNNVVTISGSGGSLQPNMNGGTVLLGGNAFYDFNIGAVSTFPDNFVCLLENDDTGRGKRINVAGPSDLPAQFILWPKQSIFLFSVGKAGSWHSSPDVTLGGLRWKLNSTTKFFINEALGNDGNDGLATGAGAFQTMQGGYGVVATALDVNGQTFIFQLDDGTFTTGLAINSTWTGGGGFLITGNAANPDNVFVNVSSGAGPSSGYPFIVSSYPGGVVVIQHLKFASSVSNARGISLLSPGNLQITDVIAGSCPVAHFEAGVPGASLFWIGPIKVIGTSGFLLVSDASALFSASSSATVTFVRSGGQPMMFSSATFFAGASAAADAQLTTLVNDAGKQRRTATGDVTIGSPNITNLSINTNLLSTGMSVTGLGIPFTAPPGAATTIINILSPNSVQLSANATATNLATTVKFEIAHGQKFLVQSSATLLGQAGAGVDFLPGDIPGVQTQNGVYIG